MKLIRRSTPGKKFDQRSCVTIGNFDGLHLGHAELIKNLEDKISGRSDVRKVAMSFYPHPRRVVQNISREDVIGDPKFFHLTPLRSKYGLFKKHRFDDLLLIRFSKELSQLSAKDFVKQYLVDYLNVEHVVVGYDWCFGKDREGTTEKLSSLGDEFGFSVSVVPAVQMHGVKVGSTSIKQCLKAGMLEVANEQLGRYYSMRGRVVHGDKRGKSIGFPTANIKTFMQIKPLDGVYATIATVDGRPYQSVTNIGFRPTGKGKQHKIETHILEGGDFDLYGKNIGLQFVERIREEKKFPSFTELSIQIASDCKKAQEILRGIT